jgi:DNA segregation ATPase FtsK/SpoIIIE, S-DNA-T family
MPASNKSKKLKPEHSMPVWFNEVIGIAMCGVGAILFMALITYTPVDLPSLIRPIDEGAKPPQQNWIGVMGALAAWIVFLAFGAAAYLIPVTLTWLGVAYSAMGSTWTKRKWIGMFAIIFTGSCLVAVQDWFFQDWAIVVELKKTENSVSTLYTGGYVGYWVGQSFLEPLLAKPGAIIFLGLVYLLSTILITGIHPIKLAKALLTMSRDWVSEQKFNFEVSKEKKQAETLKKNEKERMRAEREASRRTAEALKRGRENQQLTASQATQDFSKSQELTKATQLAKKLVKSEQLKLEPLDRSSIELETPKTVTDKVVAEKPEPRKPEPMRPEPMKPESVKPASTFPKPQIIDSAAAKKNRTIIAGDRPFSKKSSDNPSLSVGGFEAYETPGFDLLSYEENSVAEPEADSEALIALQNTIVETLKAFGVVVTPGDITRGPTISRFEVYPSVGLRVSRISQLEADLARATKAERINILAPIPGKDTVGIEIENNSRVAVPLRELLQDPAFTSAKKKIPLALGKDVYGNVVIGDLAAMPHLLVAGATGAGKSVCINSIITSILFKFSPDELRFIMVDPKVVEMQIYGSLPHLVVPVVTDPSKVVAALRWVVNEMEKRYRIFAKCGVRNFDGFNNRPRPEKEKVKEPEPEPVEEEPEFVDEQHIESIAKALEDGDLGPSSYYDDDEEDLKVEEKIPDRIPYIVVIIDELADLMQTAPADVEGSIARIAQKARAAGIHLIIATQSPRAEVVTGIIKANIPSRIAFQVSSALDSRVILDSKGAEKLVGKGDMLYLPPGSAKLERSQGAFVSDEEVEAIVAFCSNQCGQSFEKEIQDCIDGGNSGDGDEKVSDADEDCYQKCLEVIRAEGKASTSLLQRRLRLGYTRAARMMDILEERRVIGPADGARARDILIPTDAD